MSSRQLFRIRTHTGQVVWTSPLPPDQTIGLATLTREAILIVSWPRASDGDEQSDVTVSSIDRDTGRLSHRARLAEADPLAVLHQIAVYDGALILQGGSTLIGWTTAKATTAPR